jgi:hypothetical protein
MLLGLTLQAGVWMGLHLPVLFGRGAHLSVIEASFQSAASILAFTLALALNVEIAGEYRQTPWLRWAWLFLGANAGLSILREVVESPLFNLVWDGYTDGPLQGLHQHLVIVPANSFLVLGLVGMWWAYRRVGLGFVNKGYDYAQIAGILFVLLALLFSRQGLTQADSPYLVGRVLQHVGLVLLATAAAASVVLHRMAVQMGGGKLALALQCLTLYTALRATLVLAEALLFLRMPEWRQTNGLLHFFDTLCWQTVPWLAALAAAYRAELTVHAQKELQRFLAAKAAPIAV